MISKRFLLTVGMILLIALIAGVGVFFAKGYRVSPDTGMITGTGIMSVTSLPDQASVYLDGHLTSATNTNINSLSPKEYGVKITKEGFIPWEKQVKVYEGLVTDVKATLFRAIPSVYPLTYTGAEKVLLSPNQLRLLYVVPPNPGDTVLNKKTGVWIWDMGDQPIGFNRGGGLRQIAVNDANTDFTKADFRFSPDSTQLLANFPDRHLLLEVDRFTDTPRDITAILDSTMRSWDEDQRQIQDARLELITDQNIRNEASSAAILKWSPDETKILFSKDGKTDFKVVALQERREASLPSVDPSDKLFVPNQFVVHNLPAAASYEWLADSEHIILVETAGPIATPGPTPRGQIASASAQVASNFVNSKVSIIEYDGANKAEIYAGMINPMAVVAWPDNSKIVVVSTLPLATASQPNLYGINLK